MGVVTTTIDMVIEYLVFLFSYLFQHYLLFKDKWLRPLWAWHSIAFIMKV